MNTSCSSSINISNWEMCYNDNDNDSSTLYCCLYCCSYCCFAELFLLLSLAYSRLCYHVVLLYSFLRVVLLVLVVLVATIVVGCVPSTSSSLSSSVIRHLSSACPFLLLSRCIVVSFVSRCFALCRVVSSCCCCCCPCLLKQRMREYSQSLYP